MLESAAWTKPTGRSAWTAAGLLLCVAFAAAGCAYGYFEALANVTQWTKAGFSTGRKANRSIYALLHGSRERGSADTVRDPRGFAIKFYTEDGNYDLVGNNTPVFFIIRDPLKFPDFIHSQKRDPYTNIQEPDNIWDFFSLSPEATHQFVIFSSDRGIPASFATWTALDRIRFNGTMHAVKSSG
jgi:catalase